MRFWIGVTMFFIPIAGFFVFMIYSALMGDQGAMFGLVVTTWLGTIYWLLKGAL